MGRTIFGVVLCVGVAIGIAALARPKPVPPAAVEVPAVVIPVEPVPIVPEPPPPTLVPLPEPVPTPEPLPAPEEPEPPSPTEVADGRKVYVTATAVELEPFVQAYYDEHPTEEPYQKLGFVLNQSRLAAAECPPDKPLWLVPWEFYLKHLIVKQNDIGVPEHLEDFTRTSPGKEPP